MRGQIDKTLLITVVVLFAVGLLVLASASMVIADKKVGDAFFYVKKQALYGAAGLGVMFLLALFIPYKVYRKWSYILILVSLVAMILVFLPEVGVVRNNAQRWVKIFGFEFQPSELLKLTGVIFLAAWAQAIGPQIKNFKKGVVPFLIFLGVAMALLVLQPDVGTLLVIIVSLGAAYLVAGPKIRHVLLIILVLGVLFAGITLAKPYRAERMKVFLKTVSNPTAEGYQIKQATLAIGGGGLFGRGFAQSEQKVGYLPEPFGDSIFAVLAEEFGFVGGVIIVLAFLVFAWRGFRIAVRAPDIFGRVLAAGITTFIVAQAFVNIGAISGVFPLTGIPLPFISHGGSSLLIAMASSGILLNISRSSR